MKWDFVDRVGQEQIKYTIKYIWEKKINYD